jgi:Fe-S-cluster containining protein
VSEQPPRYSDGEAAARTAAIAALKAGLGPAGAARAAIDVASSFLAEVVERINLAPQMSTLQCGPGCSFCCHQMVGVTIAELALVKEAIAALPDPERRDVGLRIKDMARRGKGLSQAQWWAARLPCPLLDETGKCMVHAARPLPCRAMNSRDAATCRRSFAGEELQIPILAAPQRIHAHAQLGLAKALAECGEDTQVVALGVSLRE